MKGVDSVGADEIENYGKTLTAVSPEQQVMGILSPALTLLLVFIGRLAREGNDEMLRLQRLLPDCRTMTEKGELNEKIVGIRERYKAVTRFFWAEVRENFGLFGAEKVGIAAGWSVVVNPMCGCGKRHSTGTVGDEASLRAELSGFLSMLSGGIMTRPPKTTRVRFRNGGIEIDGMMMD